MTEPDFPVGGNRHQPLGWKSHPGLRTIDETAQRLDLTKDQVHELLRAGKLRAIWARKGRRVTPGITEKSLKPHIEAADARRAKRERILQQRGQVRRCPRCGRNIPVRKDHLIEQHRDPNGRNCPGGIHGRSRFPIPGDHRKGPRIHDDETPDQWLADAGLMRLTDALHQLNLPERVFADLIAKKKIEAVWVRWDGQAHPAVDRDDVQAVIAARDKINPPPDNPPPSSHTPTWMAANT